MSRAARKQGLKARNALSEAVRADASRRIEEFVMEMIRGGETVFVYASYRTEVDTGHLIRRLRDAGCRVCLPRIIGEGMMEAADAPEAAVMALDRYGIPYPEDTAVVLPEDIDIALIPGAAFDRNGGRTGYGAGYYDRFLCRTHALRVGLCFAAQLVEDTEPQPHDVPMDRVVTEDGVFIRDARSDR